MEYAAWVLRRYASYWLKTLRYGEPHNTLVTLWRPLLLAYHYGSLVIGHWSRRWRHDGWVAWRHCYYHWGGHIIGHWLPVRSLAGYATMWRYGIATVWLAG